MNEYDKAKIKNWGSEIRVLEGKIQNVKQKDLDILYKENEKVVGKCFQKENAYMKIMSSYEDELFCNEINFDLTDLGIDDDLGFNSLKEIKNERYDEISFEVFDKQIENKAQEFMKKFFKVEE